MTKIMQEFDERQLHIRSQIFFHALLVAIVLLLVSSAIQAAGTISLSGYVLDIAIVLVTTLVIAMEAILRGAFFGRQQNHWVIIVAFGLSGLSLTLPRLFDLLGWNKATSITGLSFSTADSVVLIVIGIFFILTAVVGISYEFKNKHATSE